MQDCLFTVTLVDSDLFIYLFSLHQIFLWDVCVNLILSTSCYCMVSLSAKKVPLNKMY